MIRQNFKYKLLALVIALIIWTYADLGQNQNSVRELSGITLQLKGLEPGYLAACTPDSVRVLLEGSKNHLEAIAENADLITAQVDLRGRTSGRYNLPVKLILPKGFAALVSKRVTPEKVYVSLEPKISRLHTIDIQMISAPKSGYQFAEPMISPGKAVISGPSKLVNSVMKLAVSLDVGDSAGSIEGDFTVMALDRKGKSVQGVEINPGSVHLRMELLESPGSRIVYVTPNLVGRPAFPNHVTSIEVMPQTLVLSGKADILAGAGTLFTDPINIANRTRTFTQTVNAVIPSGLTVKGDKSIKVTVNIAPDQGQDANPPAPDSRLR